MTDAKERDWVDLLGKILVPVLIAAFGSFYAFYKDREDRQQQEWERDSGYVKLLASSNEDERALGLAIIQVLQTKGRFPQELTPVVNIVAKRAATSRPSDPSKQTAIQVLSKLPDSGAQEIPANKDASQSRSVYIQIGHEDQRQKAKELQSRLREAGFTVPEIELVAHPTNHTYVRYFNTSSMDSANKIKDLMANQGITSEIQSFVLSSPLNSQDTSGALEVWLGDKEKF